MKTFGTHLGNDIVWEDSKNHQFITWDNDQTFRVYKTPYVFGHIMEVFSICVSKDLWEHDEDVFLSKLADLST